MKFDNAKHVGRLEVDEDLHFAGRLDGEMIVQAGVHVLMTGHVSGYLVASAGSKLEVHGVVEGSVRNEGGDVEIQGIVRGSLYGPCRVTAGAKVSG